MENSKELVAILDAGAQYGKLIDRHIRELNVETELIPFDTPATTIQRMGYKAIVISGGPESVYSPSAPVYDKSIFDLGLPIFGICYGIQVLFA